METKEIKEWFKKQPIWLQRASKLIIEQGVLKDTDYDNLYKCCLNEAKEENQNPNVDIPIDQLLNSTTYNDRIKLKSMEDIVGINDLSPRNPLNFGDEKLSIIYGDNASGKSGYARILKNISGKPCSLLPNIYKSEQLQGKCTIKYEKENEIKTESWQVVDRPIDDLRSVDIFDSECGSSYIEDENQVTYEPKILSFFSNLVRVCEKVSSKIEDEKGKKPSKKPAYPSEYNLTEGAKWYNESLSGKTIEDDLNQYCSWTEDNKKDLTEFQKRLVQEDPKKKAEEIRQKNTAIKGLINDTCNLLKSLSDENYKKLNKFKEEYATAKKTAKIAADQNFEQLPLKGVGSEPWKQLWLYAKEYSEKEAYKGQSFPVIDDALCVLCHQELDGKAKKRFESFNEFIKEAIQKTLEDKKQSLKDFIKTLPEIPEQEYLRIKLEAGELQLDNNTQLKSLYIQLEERKKQLTILGNQSELTSLPSIEEWKKEAEKIIRDRENQAQQYEEDAKEDNRESLLVKQKDLRMKEWLFQHIDAIKKEIERLKYVEILNSAKKLTDTTKISKYKSKLSEELITQDFVNRFNVELKELKAENIKVEIFRSKIEKGKALHQIRLKGVRSKNIKPKNVLSEGENRIVALSAFLADATGGNPSTPFVFDDPISSLDQIFEEAVARRLVKLAKERQVIIFTHRLSMFGLIEELSKDNNIDTNILTVTKEPWGAGEPGDIPLFATKPKTDLNSLIEKLPEAKKVLTEKGTKEYNKEANSLISDFRKTIEKTIESVLLKGIIKRHRRQIRSKKVKELSKIKPEDCQLIDELMTKYSTLLHPPSDETSVQLPEPDELEKDFKKLKNWIDEFNNRTTE